MPLISRKLKISEYEPLINKLVNKFSAWSVKALFFSRRVQLLNSVITSIVNFWLSAFLQPQACIKKMESLCSRFLWTNNIESLRGAKVFWSTLCLPKDEGGLGLRRFSVWNKALCLLFIWRFLSNNDSLWVAWQKILHLRTKSFWEVDKSTHDSWTWKQLLKLRPEAMRFIKAELGNGKVICFWYDIWTPFGLLISYVGEGGPRSLRIPLEAKVVDAFDNVRWRLASPRSEASLDLPNYCYEWCDDGVSSNQYLASTTWAAMRLRSDVKSWADLIWFKGHIPKHAFTMWAANYNSLPTRSRLFSWGMHVPKDCCLCGRNQGSHVSVL